MIEKYTKIFVSYTLRDKIITLNYLNELDGYLKVFCIPFIDIIHNDSLDKQKRVENELMNSKLLLLLFTDGCKYSNWVNREIEIANTNNIPIKVIQISDSYISKEFINEIECYINQEH